MLHQSQLGCLKLGASSAEPTQCAYLRPNQWVFHSLSLFLCKLTNTNEYTCMFYNVAHRFKRRFWKQFFLLLARRVIAVTQANRQNIKECFSTLATTPPRVKITFSFLIRGKHSLFQSICSGDDMDDHIIQAVLWRQGIFSGRCWKVAGALSKPKGNVSNW